MIINETAEYIKPPIITAPIEKLSMKTPQNAVAVIVPTFAEVRNKPFAKSGASGTVCDSQY